MAGRKVIFVVTNDNRPLGNPPKKTGAYLPEVAHPYSVLSEAGFEITFVSPKGRKGPIDEGSREAFNNDDVCQKFLKDHGSELDNTQTPSQVLSKISEYKALFYAGGHGPMFDIPENAEIAKLGRRVYEQGGVLGAVCHGTVGFVPITLSSGEPVVKGKNVTSFTNAEEELVQLVDSMPFLLETKLEKLGANFINGGNWKENVQVDGRLVTGQNPASATKVGQEMLKLLK